MHLNGQFIPCVAEGFLHTDLPTHERHVADDERALRAAADDLAVVADVIEGHRHGRVVALDDGAHRVTDEQQVESAIGSTVARHGRLDVLFNNAGIQVPGFPSTRFEEFTEEAVAASVVTEETERVPPEEGEEDDDSLWDVGASIWNTVKGVFD